ncbi:recombinase family protein [Natranaerobius thermophilus]|uniref:recombinase family protein n=1 Tax=Natranaerobius thermophilus TaxID=375929 RepID=UPI0039C85F23
MIYLNNYYGYIRVSTDEQNESRQLQALKQFEKDHEVKLTIFMDKLTGKCFSEREQYQALKKVVAPGDVIVIKELDRLGRTYDQIKQELTEFRNINVQVVILDLPTFTDVKDQKLGKLLNNLMVELLSYFAEKEHERITERVREGVRQAQKEGKPIGRPKRKLPKNFSKWYPEWKNGDMTAVEFARIMGVSKPTIYRYIRHYENHN